MNPRDEALMHEMSLEKIDKFYDGIAEVVSHLFKQTVRDQIKRQLSYRLRDNIHTYIGECLDFNVLSIDSLDRSMIVKIKIRDSEKSKL